jgi:hypothetical protein
MNFVKDYNKPKVPVFANKFTVPALAQAPVADKYQDAIDKVTRQYGNSKLEIDKVNLKNILASIEGLKAEEADGEIQAEEASRTLTALIAKHIGGRRRKTRRSKRSKTHRRRK